MYEYRCPECKATNTREHKTIRVVCSKCGHEWEPEGAVATIRIIEVVKERVIEREPTYIPWVYPTYPTYPNPSYPTWIVTSGTSVANPQPAGDTYCLG